MDAADRINEYIRLQQIVNKLKREKAHWRVIEEAEKKAAEAFKKILIDIKKRPS